MRTLSCVTANILAFVYANLLSLTLSLSLSLSLYSNVGNKHYDLLLVGEESVGRRNIYLSELSSWRQLLSTTRLKILAFTR
jgi:hypothetical protein